MPKGKRLKYSRISAEERTYLSLLWNEFGLSYSQISREMKRTRRVIYAELERGYNGEANPDGRKRYDPKLAAMVYQTKQDERVIKQSQTKALKRREADAK
jgi:IS30 family transposase